MDLYYIDHISVSARSWLHKTRVRWKMLGLVAIIAAMLQLHSLLPELAVFLAVITLALTARVPIRVYLPLALYPVVFLIVILLSIQGLTVYTAAVLTLRVLGIAASVVLFLLTTSYPAIFETLGRVLPGFLVAGLFFAYRSLFIISDSLRNIQTALHLRGGVNWRKHPVSTVRNLGTAMGHLLVNSIETSQRMADGLKIRGFKNRIYYLRGER